MHGHTWKPHAGTSRTASPGATGPCSTHTHPCTHTNKRTAGKQHRTEGGATVGRSCEGAHLGTANHGGTCELYCRCHHLRCRRRGSGLHPVPRCAAEAHRADCSERGVYCNATTRLAGGNWPATAALHGREGERCCGRTARGRASEPHRALLRTTRIQREEELDGMSGCCDGGASFYCRHGGAGSRRCRGPNCHPLLVELHARMGRTARRCGPSQIWRRWPGSVRRRRSTSAGR